MFRQLEKTDDAAIGMLLNTGAELSFKNLLSAVSTNKKQGMDIMINDSFAGIDALAKEETITAQISSGFNKTYRDIARSAADQMAKQDASTEADYQEAQVEEYRQWN